MKKLNVLIAAALLSTASVTYADALDDVLEKLGMTRSDLENILPETGGDEEIAEILALWEIPDQIFWDNSDPVTNMRLCGVDPPIMDDTTLDPNRMMADFEVTVKGSYVDAASLMAGPFGETTLFTAGPPGVEGGGEAKSAEVHIQSGKPLWQLRQYGRETWNKMWTIELAGGVTLDSIEINLLSKKTNPKAAFDILLRPNDDKYPSYNLGTHNNDGVDVNIGTINHPSPGSGAGWPVQPMKPFAKIPVGPPVLYTATFHNPIVLPGSNLVVDEEGDEKPHDLYGKVFINFVIENNGAILQNGIQHDVPFDLVMVFWQDTDCLPTDHFDVTNVIASETGNYQASYEISTGLGMNVYVTRSRDPNTPQDERDVFKYIGYFGSDTGIHTGTINVEPGFCYWAEDWTDTGLKEDKFGGCL